MPLFVVSPHLDDAALSCGELLSTVEGSTVLTVFAGVPKSTTILTKWDCDCGFRAADDVMGIRREEDRRALSHLRSAPRWLDLLDCQYTDEPVAPSEISSLLARELEGKDVGALAFPLGLQHFDHNRVHLACLELLETRRELARRWVLFADVPYRAAHGRQASQRVRSLRQKGFKVQPLLFAGSPETKARAIAEYRSQLWALPELSDARLPEECFLVT